MNLPEIVKTATNKASFLSIADYVEFSKHYLQFAAKNLQAVIVSQNENHYCFYQYKEDGFFNITRPINSNLMFGFDDVRQIEKEFPKVLNAVRELPKDDAANRALIIKSIYTIQ